MSADHNLEVKSLLRSIGAHALERDVTNHRPLICYALHPDVMSDEEYNFLTLNYKPADWISNKYYNYKAGGENVKGYVAGILVFLIRRFFEKSNGRKSRSVWGLSNDQHSTLVDMIGVCADKTWGRDYGFPAKDSNDLQEWLRFQCWVLKCGEKEKTEKKNGGTASRLKNNAAVYKLCSKPKCEEVLDYKRWESFCPASLDNITVDSYVKELLENHWKEYLLSLCVMVKDDEDWLPDEDEWKWLQPLCNIAEKKKKKTAKAEWGLFDGKGKKWIRLVIDEKSIERKDKKNYKFCQGHAEYAISDGNLEIKPETLLENGFDIFSEIKLYKNQTYMSDVSPLQEGKYMFFTRSHNMNDETWYKQIEDETKYVNSIIIVHAGDIYDVEIKVHPKGSLCPIKKKCKLTSVGKELQGIPGWKYSTCILPELWNDEQLRQDQTDRFTLLIDGSEALEMTNPLRVSIMDIEKNMTVMIGNKKIHNVCIAREAEFGQCLNVGIERWGRFRILRTNPNPPVMFKSKSEIRVPESAFWNILQVDCMTKKEENQKDPEISESIQFIVMPKDWRSTCDLAPDWCIRGRENKESWRSKEHGLIIIRKIAEDSPLIWGWERKNFAPKNAKEAMEFDELDDADQLFVFAHIKTDYNLRIKREGDETSEMLIAQPEESYGAPKIRRKIELWKKKHTGRYEVVLERKGAAEQYTVLKGF